MKGFRDHVKHLMEECESMPMEMDMQVASRKRRHSHEDMAKYMTMYKDGMMSVMGNVSCVGMKAGLMDSNMGKIKYRVFNLYSVKSKWLWH